MREQVWFSKKKRISNSEVLIKFHIGNYSNKSSAERSFWDGSVFVLSFEITNLI